MKNVVFWLGALLIVGVMSMMILHKEQVIASGQTVLLRLAPVDPRSLMQGDYMILRYAMAREVPDTGADEEGWLVIRLDESEVGQFVRIHASEELAPGELLLAYKRRGEVRIGAEGFFFQGGEAKRFARAWYGELKVDTKGKSVLVGLRDDKLKKL